jgi:hypothetical protein
MRSCDVAVLGLMGSAALEALLTAGVDALGFDRLGTGAKFAAAIGQKLARLATDPSYEVEPFFQLSRYSAFA